MQAKTTLERNGQEVTIYECHIFIKDRLKNFCIKESDQYFENEKRAIRAARDLLLRKTLPKYRYLEKQKEKRKRIGARKIINIYDCHKDTLTYIKRWDGILYLETKKHLLAELQSKLDEACTRYEFKNAHAAIGFTEGLKLKRK